MAEAMEIVRSHLPRAVMRYVDPFRLRLGKRARVGRMSDMPVAGPGGVDLHLQAHRLRLAPESGLGQRRTADIAQTDARSEEHTSELQSLMRSSYAVSCLQTKHHKSI